MYRPVRSIIDNGQMVLFRPFESNGIYKRIILNDLFSKPQRKGGT
jgi:hypothetical protein